MPEITALPPKSPARAETAPDRECLLWVESRHHLAYGYAVQDLYGDDARLFGFLKKMKGQGSKPDHAPEQTHELDVFADYFQFYVSDEAYQTDTGEIWDQATTDRMLALGSDLIAVGTARNMDVPVTLEIRKDEPPLDFDRWDQVIDCGITVSSGNLVVFGCTEDPTQAPRFRVAPGDYRARISYGDLSDLSEDGLDGNDRYRVQLWPGASPSVTVLKHRPS